MSSFSSFVFAADLHLRRCAWVGRPSLSGDAYYALEQVVDYCLLKHIPAVLAGDVFDAVRPPEEAVRALKVQVRRMREAGLPVYVITGNQDPDPWPALLDGVTHVDRQLFSPCDGVVAYGLDFRFPAELQEALANVPPEANVLVGHQMLDLAMPIEGSNNLRAEWVPGHVRAVLLEGLPTVSTGVRSAAVQ